MLKMTQWIAAVFSFIFLMSGTAARAQGYLPGQDLRVSAERLTIFEPEDPAAAKVVILDGGVSLSIGSNSMTAEKAVLWLERINFDYIGNRRTDFQAQVYLEGDVNYTAGKMSKTVDMNASTVENGKSLVTRFTVTGEVYITAEEHFREKFEDLGEEEIYSRATEIIVPARRGPVIDPQALVPRFPAESRSGVMVAGREEPIPGQEKWQRTDIFGFEQPAVQSIADDSKGATKVRVDRPVPMPEPEKTAQFRYPVNVAGLWEPGPEIEKTQMADGTNVATVIGKFYIWQKLDDEGSLLEFQADSAVLFYDDEPIEEDRQGSNLISGQVQAVYLRGNIIMTEGTATMRADEMYYDFRKRQALAVNGERRMFDPDRGVPIYLRADEIRQISQNVFTAEDAMLTSSEFADPQVQLTASSVIITDITDVERRAGEQVEKKKYEGVFKDTLLKMDGLPIFYWPKIRADLERPDIPLRRATVGYDDDFGFTTETRWDLAKLLSRREPEGVDSTLALDYYGERGMGAGLRTRYARHNYFGNILAYALTDRGDDDLGSISSRKNLDPGEDIRGRFRWRHRQFLPYDWQATVEVSYASDENFIEWFNRSEFDTGKAQETLVHLKRITDNWGISILNKFRITPHRSIVEELPSIEYHLKGQSFFDHKLTYYTSSKVSRFRNLYPNGDPDVVPEQFYTFFSTRHQVDAPMQIGTVKFVPFVAGSVGFNDMSQTAYERGVNNDLVEPDKSVFLGEFGARLSTMLWKDYPNVKSRLWDLDGIRHIIKPHAEIVRYIERDETVGMRDMYNIGVLNRWLTHRGEGPTARTVEWQRLDLNLTWISDAADDTAGPARFLWNNSVVPLLLRRNTPYYSILRDSFTADYTWRISDTTTFLSDMSYDVKSGVVQQLNAGFSRYIYPDIKYYIGSRYLKRAIVSVPGDNVYEEGSHSVVTAMTYSLNNRYTFVLSEEFNTDYGENVRTEAALIRQYRRMYYSLSYEKDYSRDRERVMFSMWPEGVSELALGSRDYVGIGGYTIEE